MFIICLSYIKDLSEVDKHIDNHISYLQKYYSLGKFIISGRKSPRTGGVIIADCQNKDEATMIAEEDPFFKNKIANFEIIEFTPTMTCPEFDKFKN